MKELSKKVIELGLVPEQTIKLLKRWQALPMDAPEEEALKATEEQLHQFVEDIQELVDAERTIPEIKEFEPDLHSLIYDEGRKTTLRPRGPSPDHIRKTLMVGKSRTGKFVFYDSELQDEHGRILNRGATFVYDDKVMRVVEIETRWEGNLPTYYVCEAEEIHNA